MSRPEESQAAEPARAGTMQIGEVAECVGLSLRTIRHYEDVGLLTPAGRTKGGFRLYDDADCARLRMLKHMKPLEYSLEEMRDLVRVVDALATTAPGGGPEAELIDRLDTYREGIDQRAQRLARQLDQVTDLRGQLASLVEERRPSSITRPQAG